MVYEESPRSLINPASVSLRGSHFITFQIYKENIDCITILTLTRTLNRILYVTPLHVTPLHVTPQHVTRHDVTPYLVLSRKHICYVGVRRLAQRRVRAQVRARVRAQVRTQVRAQVRAQVRLRVWDR